MCMYHHVLHVHGQNKTLHLVLISANMYMYCTCTVHVACSAGLIKFLACIFLVSVMTDSFVLYMYMYVYLEQN